MHFEKLKPSDSMPVLFLGHGSPMNAITDNEYRRSWQALGARFGSDWPTPQLILCISAHWLTDGWWLTAMAQPKTIHDFGGFPQELFDQQYPAPGAPDAAAGCQPATTRAASVRRRRRPLAAAAASGASASASPGRRSHSRGEPTATSRTLSHSSSTHSLARTSRCQHV